jgi:hypothetical protein
MLPDQVRFAIAVEVIASHGPPTRHRSTDNVASGMKVALRPGEIPDVDLT